MDFFLHIIDVRAIIEKLIKTTTDLVTLKRNNSLTISEYYHRCRLTKRTLKNLQVQYKIMEVLRVLRAEV